MTSKDSSYLTEHGIAKVLEMDEIVCAKCGNKIAFGIVGRDEVIQQARLNAIDECLEVIKNHDHSDRISEMHLCTVFIKVEKLKESGK
jgi:hypothetical protein